MVHVKIKYTCEFKRWYEQMWSFASLGLFGQVFMWWKLSVKWNENDVIWGYVYSAI